jgi:XTP/dITP diphosphohydrolase
MTHVRNRRARFRTIIALILDGNEYLFEGVIRGEIMTEKHGQGGFGYDPVFRPDGYGLTFGEMPSREKNQISHRAVAVGKLIEFLRHRAQFR